MGAIVSREEFDIYDECRGTLDVFHKQVVGHRVGVLTSGCSGSPHAREVCESLLEIDIEARIVDAREGASIDSFPCVLICDETFNSSQFRGHLETRRIFPVGSTSLAVAKTADRDFLMRALRSADVPADLSDKRDGEFVVSMLEVSSGWVLLPTLQCLASSEQVPVSIEKSVARALTDAIARIVRLVQPNGYFSVRYTLDGCPVVTDIDLTSRLDRSGHVFRSAKFLGLDHGNMLLTIMAECFRRNRIVLPNRLEQTS